MTSSPSGFLSRSAVVDLTATEPTARPDIQIEELQPSRWQRVQRALSFSLDRAVVTVIVAVGAFRRRGVLPLDGYWHDDAWVVTSIRHSDLSGFFTTTGGVPGYVWLNKVALLLGPPQLVIPLVGLLLGLALPVVGYVAAKYVLQSRWLAVGFASVLALAPQYVEYSGRVKTYNLDAAVLVGLFAYTWLEASRVPTNRRLLAEALAVVVISSVSPWTALAAVSFCAARVATLGRGRWKHASVPLAASSLVGASQLFMRAGYNGERVNEAWRSFGAFPHSSPALPLDLAYRATQVIRLLVPGPDIVRVVVLALACIGLALTSRRSRFAGLFVVFMGVAAAVATSIGRMPFGGETFRVLRGSMWLAPLLLLIALVAANRLFQLLAQRNIVAPQQSAPVMGLALIGLAVVLATTTLPRQRFYELDGLESAMSFYEGSRAEGDIMFAANGSHRSVTAALDSEVVLVGSAQSGHGFQTEVGRPDIVFTLPVFKQTLETAPHSLGLSRVYVLTVGQQGLRKAEETLPDVLFESGRRPTVAMEGRVVSVVVWESQELLSDVN